MTEQPLATAASVIHRIESGDHAVAGDLSEMLARGELTHEVAVECVPHAWRWNNRPLADLRQDRWIELFRFTGYTHDYAPAARPSGRALARTSPRNSQSATSMPVSCSTVEIGRHPTGLPRVVFETAVR